MSWDILSEDGEKGCDDSDKAKGEDGETGGLI